MSEIVTSLVDSAAGANGLTESEKNAVLLKKMIKELEQTRKVVEAQNRKLEIEAALERVRAKAMAMHNSTELDEVLTVLFDQFDILGIDSVSTHMTLIDIDNNTFTFRETGKGGHQSYGEQKVAIDSMDIWKEAADKWRTSEPLSINRLHFPREMLPQVWQVFHESFASMPEGAKIYPEDYPDGIYHTAGNCKFGYIGMNQTKKATEEEEQIVLKFATEFGRLYQRFLDLQKAEAQAREAQIEAALERVRARAMGMHSSSELSDVLSVLFGQYDLLGISPVFCHLTLFDLKNNKFSYRTTGRNGQRVQAEQIIDIDAVDAWKDSVENWKKGGPDQVNAHMYPNEILPFVFQLFQEILSAIPEEAKFYPEDFPDGLFITQGYCKFGYVGFGHYRESTPQEREVVRKMATEFERLYQRFIDLQTSETQIKEAQIEASLERVRASAMAMHSSDDVGNATGVLFSELDKLDISLLRCGLIIFNGKEKTMQVWRATTTKDGTIGQATGKVSISIHPMLEKAYDYWIRKEVFFCYDLSAEELLNYFKALSNNAPQFTKSVTTEKQTGTCFFFKEGAIFTFTKDPLDAEASSVLAKFAAVFSLTYRRYLDLRNAEMQAKDVVKQASLDRIRAEIASMRTTGDLQRITPLIWNELTVLGVPFIRCGVFIMDDLQQIVHTYLSTPDGKAVAAFDLPYSTPGNVSQIVLRWKNKELFTEYWDEETYTEFGRNLVQQGVFTSTEQYLSTLPGGGFYLHCLPFLQGMLYVGNITQLGEDDIKLIQSIADAFSTAYARYEDFNKLEAAKQQVDKTLLDLKQAQQQLIQKEKMASLGELTAGIAHEIQNPLNFVNNFSEVNNELLEELKEQLATGNKQEAMMIAEDIKANEQKINHHGKRADAIVKGMLQHSRKSSDKKELTDINALVDEYLRLSYHGLRAKNKTFNATFKTAFDESIPKVDVVPQDIGRVLLNLFNNAFYAAPLPPQGGFKDPLQKHEPTVQVKTSKNPASGGRGAGVSVSVRDNGPGIPKNIVDKIFQPFFTTKPTGQGTGLGLSLSYDIIKAHGGELKVKTKEGEGAEFIIHLPI